MELRLPLEVSPGREATCRAVFGTWGSFPDDARAGHCPFVLASFTGWSSERCPGIGFLPWLLRSSARRALTFYPCWTCVRTLYLCIRAGLQPVSPRPIYSNGSVRPSPASGRGLIVRLGCRLRKALRFLSVKSDAHLPLGNPLWLRPLL